VEKEGLDGVIRENVPIKYMMPIVWETIKQGKVNEAFVKGVAIAATTSRNNVVYKVEELEKSYPTLGGKNLSVGHNDNPEDNIGLIENVEFDGNNVNYFARIFNTHKHPDAVEMVRNKLWQYVSIEAIVPKLVKEDDKYIAQGINFTGLSFVKTPGIENASAFLAGESFGKAIAEGYNLIQEDENMAEEEKTEEVEETPAEEVTPEEPKAEEKVDVSKLVSEKVSEELARIAEETRVKKLEEEVKELKKKLEEGAKSEAVVGETTKETATNLIVEGAGGGNASFYVMPSSDGKLRRAE